MALKWDAFEFRVGNFDFLGVVAGVQFGGDFQACGGRGAANQRQPLAESSQGFAGPIHRDETEQPMFDPIPFRGARRRVTDGDCQARLGGEVLPFAFPQTTAGRIAAAAIGQQQPLAAAGVEGLGGSPPTPQTVDRELRGVGRSSHAHVSAIAAHVVQAVGDGCSRSLVVSPWAACFVPSPRPCGARVRVLRIQPSGWIGHRDADSLSERRIRVE